MRMTPASMMVLRLLNLTICRFRYGDGFMRRVLERVAPPKSKDVAPYCQSADFFSYDQLNDSPSGSAPEPGRND